MSPDNKEAFHYSQTLLTMIYIFDNIFELIKTQNQKPMWYQNYILAIVGPSF